MRKNKPARLYEYEVFEVPERILILASIIVFWAFLIIGLAFRQYPVIGA